MGAWRTCECGECRKCKHREYMNAYYRRNPQKIRDIANASRSRRLEQVQADDRARGPWRPGRTAEKVWARNTLNHAIEAGRVVRESCEVCGEPDAHGHHDDYSKPLDVRWLCRTHHAELHRVIA